MTSIGLFEAKTHLSALAKRVAGGEEIVVTDRGRPVMKLTPIEDAREPDAESLARQLEALRREGVAWRKGKRQAPMTIEEVIALVGEGRR
jgi:prevent-host-death family protein